MLEKLHDRLVFQRRVQVLVNALAPQIPANAKVLDVGCGDGLISKCLMALRPDISIQGIDVILRKAPHIEVAQFDGTQLPFDDDAFDTVMFIDVLHHTQDPNILLKEACRVSSCSLLIKDHCRDGFLAESTLRFMDWVGNSHQGVALPYNYWPETRWLKSFQNLGLEHCSWQQRLGLYPWPASLLFDRKLHFIASLQPHSGSN